MRRAAQLLSVSRGRGSCRGLARRGRTLGPHFAIWVWSQRHFDSRSAARGIFLSFGSETCDILGSRAAVLTMKNKVAAREVPGHSFVPPNPSSATRSQTSKNVRTRKDAWQKSSLGCGCQGALLPGGESQDLSQMLVLCIEVAYAESDRFAKCAGNRERDFPCFAG